MEVILVISSLRGGGAERVLVNLAQWWSDLGLRVGIVTVSGSESDAYPVPPTVKRFALGLEQPSSGIFSAMRNNFSRVRTLRRILRQESPQVVIGFMTESNVLAILASIQLSFKVLAAERIHPPRHSTSLLWRWLRRLTYRWCDTVVAQTEVTGEWLRTHCSCPIRVIPNYVIWPLKTGVPRVMPDDLLSTNERILLGVGRLSHQKGFDLFIRAFATLSHLCPEWKIVLAGTGEEGSEEELALLSLIKDLQLDGRVILTGRIGNLDSWYQRCDVFVLSSRYEGFPNVLLEAMASGCAVAAFDCEAGPADIIDHELNGLLVSPEDVTELAKALLRLMNDENFRLTLGKRAISVIEKFEPERIMRLWHEAAGLTSMVEPKNEQHHESL